jgi:phosphoglycolate phosphatase
MREIELIIFDLDGTLIDSRQDIVNGINFTLRQLCLEEKSFDEIISYVGKGIEQLIEDVTGNSSTKLTAKALGIFRDYYKKHPADHAYIYSGVKEVLDFFYKKQKFVVTNRNHNSSVALLRGMGLSNYFADIIGDDDTSCLKPSKCQFERLFKELSIKDKGRVIMVGDMDIDVLAGRAAGIITCAVTYGIGKKDDIKRAMPDYMIDAMLELKDIIK